MALLVLAFWEGSESSKERQPGSTYLLSRPFFITKDGLYLYRKYDGPLRAFGVIEV